jgi:hypothetical protein
MRVGPVSLAEAKAHIAKHHRHHRPPVGHRFSLGVWSGEELVGVACVGRPVSQILDRQGHLEITRVCAQEGAPKGVPSMLLAGAVRMARAWVHAENKRRRALGEAQLKGVRIITYTLLSETGASLRGAGFTQDKLRSDSSASRGRDWNKGGKQGKCKLGPKARWSKLL